MTIADKMTLSKVQNMSEPQVQVYDCTGVSIRSSHSSSVGAPILASVKTTDRMEWLLNLLVEYGLNIECELALYLRKVERQVMRWNMSEGRGQEGEKQ